MEFLPLDIARLVLGYLEEVGCQNSWQTFLEESKDLEEYYRLYKQGRHYYYYFPTNVNGKSLLDILKIYCTFTISNKNCNTSCNCQEKSVLNHQSLSSSNSNSVTSVGLEIDERNVQNLNEKSNQNVADKGVQTEELLPDFPNLCNAELNTSNPQKQSNTAESLTNHEFIAHSISSATSQDLITTSSSELLNAKSTFEKQNSEVGKNIHSDPSPHITSHSRVQIPFFATPVKDKENEKEERSPSNENNLTPLQKKLDQSPSSKFLQLQNTPFKLDIPAKRVLEEVKNSPEYKEIIKLLSSNKDGPESSFPNDPLDSNEADKNSNQEVNIHTLQTVINSEEIINQTVPDNGGIDENCEVPVSDEVLENDSTHSLNSDNNFLTKETALNQEANNCQNIDSNFDKNANNCVLTNLHDNPNNLTNDSSQVDKSVASVDVENVLNVPNLSSANASSDIENNAAVSSNLAAVNEAEINDNEIPKGNSELTSQSRNNNCETNQNETLDLTQVSVANSENIRNVSEVVNNHPEPQPSASQPVVAQVLNPPILQLPNFPACTVLNFSSETGQNFQYLLPHNPINSLLTFNNPATSKIFVPSSSVPLIGVSRKPNIVPRSSAILDAKSPEKVTVNNHSKNAIPSDSPSKRKRKNSNPSVDSSSKQSVSASPTKSQTKKNKICKRKKSRENDRKSKKKKKKEKSPELTTVHLHSSKHHKKKISDSSSFQRKGNKVTQEDLSNDIPVISISESPGKSATEILSRIANQFEEEHKDSVLKLLSNGVSVDENNPPCSPRRSQRLKESKVKFQLAPPVSKNGNLENVPQPQQEMNLKTHSDSLSVTNKRKMTIPMKRMKSNNIQESAIDLTAAVLDSMEEARHLAVCVKDCNSELSHEKESNSMNIINTTSTSTGLSSQANTVENVNDVLEDGEIIDLDNNSKISNSESLKKINLEEKNTEENICSVIIPNAKETNSFNILQSSSFEQLQNSVGNVTNLKFNMEVSLHGAKSPKKNSKSHTNKHSLNEVNVSLSDSTIDSTKPVSLSPPSTLECPEKSIKSVINDAKYNNQKYLKHSQTHIPTIASNSENLTMPYHDSDENRFLNISKSNREDINSVILSSCNEKKIDNYDISKRNESLKNLNGEMQKQNITKNLGQSEISLQDLKKKNVSHELKDAKLVSSKNNIERLMLENTKSKQIKLNVNSVSSNINSGDKTSMPIKKKEDSNKDCFSKTNTTNECVKFICPPKKGLQTQIHSKPPTSLSSSYHQNVDKTVVIMHSENLSTKTPNVLHKDSNTEENEKSGVKIIKGKESLTEEENIEECKADSALYKSIEDNSHILNKNTESSLEVQEIQVISKDLSNSLNPKITEDSSSGIKRKLSESDSDLHIVLDDSICSPSSTNSSPLIAGKRNCRRIYTSSSDSNITLENSPEEKRSNYPFKKSSCTYPKNGTNIQLEDDAQSLLFQSSHIKIVQNNNVASNFEKSNLKKKYIQSSPVKYVSKFKKAAPKSALTKKIVNDLNIPAGVKIPYKWNNSKIITYSHAIQESAMLDKKGEKTKKQRHTVKTNKKGGRTTSNKRETFKSVKMKLDDGKQNAREKSFPDILQTSTSRSGICGHMSSDTNMKSTRPCVELKKLPFEHISDVINNNLDQNVNEKSTTNQNKELQQTVKTVVSKGKISEPEIPNDKILVVHSKSSTTNIVDNYESVKIKLNDSKQNACEKSLSEVLQDNTSNGDPLCGYMSSDIKLKSTPYVELIKLPFEHYYGALNNKLGQNVNEKLINQDKELQQVVKATASTRKISESSETLNDKILAVHSKSPIINIRDDFESTRDMVESDIGRSTDEGSELATAIASCERELLNSTSALFSETPENDILNKRTLKKDEAPSDKSVINNDKISFILSKIGQHGIDYVLNKLKDN